MTWHEHPQAARIVRENWHCAQAFLVAAAQPCIDIRDDELDRIGQNRLLTGGLPEDLDAWRRPESWFVAVVLCPGDDTQAVARYVTANGLDPRRVHFYLHAKASRTALLAWRDQGLPLDRVDDRTEDGRRITDWAGLYSLLGRHFNVQVVEDFLAEYEA